MNTDQIEVIERKISQIYTSCNNEDLQKNELPRQAVIMVGYSEQYLAAAKVIEANLHLILPRLQMTGQAIELILKACIAGCNQTPPHDHDLIKLCKRCVNYDYCLSEADVAWIFHLNHHFYKDVVTKTKYKSRYPTGSIEPVGGVCPEVDKFQDILDKLKKQIINNIGVEYF
ncbi:MAG: HEPN domain-containing protein [Candidatus Thiodiazotropha taylori]|uniref:HEPN domain-containing protein n=1 Tax=Candidatus Thiodiazotropha taylori TaxID=2792791 RepID=A0A9E4KEP4_9GAMM|nr:HEPN domain-containing protein [Candidatus Thiodiazotropha taylori]MCW4257204.1 HEPN domain-containing protein [Candidatus Thiodiazotropha taylori]